MPSTSSRSDTLPSSEGLSRRAAMACDQPISYLMHKALAHPELISLAAGFVDQQSLPVDFTREALDWIMSDAHRARAALQYGTTHGYLPLREALLSRLLADDGTSQAEQNVTPEQIVVTAGSNQFLHLLADVLFDPGDIVLCTSPTYLVYLGVLQSAGVRAIGVEADSDGMIPESLESQLARLDATGELARVKAIYIVSYFDNPTNVTLSVERRPQIVELARRWSHQGRIHVIEDAAYRELRYDAVDIPSLRAFDSEGDTVILAQTFSKSFSPGIRVGWGVLPEHLVEPLCYLKGNCDFGSPNFAQHLMSAVLEAGLYDPHLQLLRTEYRTKLQAMLSAADEYLGPLPGVSWLKPQGGLYVWLTVPEGIDTGTDSKLFDLAIEEGMLYVPGAYCYPADGQEVPRNTIRLSFGVQSPERIRQGMAALARSIERVQRA